jgi:hypothetical protein
VFRYEADLSEVEGDMPEFRVGFTA